MMKVETCARLILQTNFGPIFEAHSFNYLFSILEGQVFRGVTVSDGLNKQASISF